MFCMRSNVGNRHPEFARTIVYRNRGLEEYMAIESVLRCFECGHEAPAGEDWDKVEHPPLGTLTQCKSCGSTNIGQHVE